jgi:hypothetical protein
MDDSASMIGFASAVRRTAHAAACANPGCSSQTWQLWMRRRHGVSLNGHWYCSDECLYTALSSVVHNPSRQPTVVHPRAHRLPLGLLLLSRGIIDEDELRSALRMQRDQPHHRIGECLEQLGSVGEDEVTRAVGAQQSLPVLLGTQADAADDIPYALLETAHCVAFRGSYSAMLYCGFDGAIDRTLISAAEEQTKCPCEPCIVSTRSVDEHLEIRFRNKRAGEVAFQSGCSASETVRTILSYAAQTHAENINIACTRRHLWARVAGNGVLDFTFPLA